MSRPLILMYHRIAEEPLDPWRMAVTPTHFEEQLSVLRRTRYPLPLSEFVRRLSDDTLPANAVALTFDDGYQDNLVAAKPLLAAADIPAAVFVVTGFIDRQEEFWWDELVALLLHNSRNGIEVVIRGQSFHFDFRCKSKSEVTEFGHIKKAI